MQKSTYYNLNLVEGTDTVNPLITDVPNYEVIDEQMHNNSIAGITLAVEVGNANVHSLTRANTECSAIRFVATTNWKAGDTATVDGVPVTVLLPNGEVPPTNAYVINANVFGVLTGSLLTIYVAPAVSNSAEDITYGDSNVAAALDAQTLKQTETDTAIVGIDTRITRLEASVGSFKQLSGIISLNTGSVVTMEKDGFLCWNVYASGHSISAAIGLNGEGQYVIPIAKAYLGAQDAGTLFLKKGMKVSANTVTGATLSITYIETE